MGLTLELLNLLGGELRGESAGGVLVVVEHSVLGLLLAAKINKNSPHQKIAVQTSIRELERPIEYPRAIS